MSKLGWQILEQTMHNLNKRSKKQSNIMKEKSN